MLDMFSYQSAEVFGKFSHQEIGNESCPCHQQARYLIARGRKCECRACSSGLFHISAPWSQTTSLNQNKTFRLSHSLSQNGLVMSQPEEFHTVILIGRKGSQAVPVERRPNGWSRGQMQIPLKEARR